MHRFASRPFAVPAFTSARRMSPVLMCTTPYRRTMCSHCVPFPDAGGPAITKCSGRVISAAKV
jgi:hypothetical protein